MGTAHYQPLRSNVWIVQEPRLTKTEPLAPKKIRRSPGRATAGRLPKSDSAYRLLAIGYWLLLNVASLLHGAFRLILARL
jgi:hypothetical protein